MKTDINKILREPEYQRYSQRGAPMGDKNIYATDHPNYNPPLRCQRVILVDGDYGPDGTYWGCTGEHIYCAFNDGRDGDRFAPAMGVRIYVRAFIHTDAKKIVQDLCPEVTFLRGGR